VAEADDAVNAHMKFSLLDNLDINQILTSGNYVASLRWFFKELMHISYHEITLVL
jgi:hypothetical protein